MQAKRFARIEDEFVVQPAVAATIDAPNANEPAGTEDLVHFINVTLSLAASYIIYTGKVYPGNFGEKLVQRVATMEERTLFSAEKEKALVAFLAERPEAYELVVSGRDGS